MKVERGTIPRSTFLQGESNGVFVQLLQYVEERFQTRPVVFPVRAQDTGEAFLTVEGDPGELPAVVIEEPGSQADTSPCSHIRKRGVVIRTVEIVDLPCSDQPVLYSFQRRRGSAPDHQSPAIQVLFSDQVPACKGIVPLRDQIDVALKEAVDMNAGDLPGLFLQGEQNIDLVAEKCLHTAFILEDKLPQRSNGRLAPPAQDKPPQRSNDRKERRSPWNISH